MEHRDAMDDDSNASVGRSWGHLEDAEALLRRGENSAIDRTRFGFRARRSSDAVSLQSDSMLPFESPFDRERFASFQRSHEASERGEEGGEDLHGEDYEEEEEEDDDDVRRSWTTEKEPVQGRFNHEISLASFRFRTQYHEEAEEEEEEEKEGEREDDGDSDASFASLEWVTRQLRQLERQTHGATADTEGGAQQDEEAAEDFDSNVREALGLLNEGRAEEQSRAGEGGGEDEWTRSAEERRGSYFDIVQEAMSVEWHRGDGYEGAEQDDQSDREEEQEDDEEEHDQTGSVQAEPTGIADEWLEAFTAKGRVYYYNRRTRESSWTRPEGLAQAHVHDHEQVENQQDHERGNEGDDEAEDELELEDEADRENESGVESQQQQGQQQQVVDHQSDHDSAPSSTSSTSSSTHITQDHELSTCEPKETLSDVLFCCFCGSQLAGTSGFQSHFGTCRTLRHHQQTASALYTQFQRMLVVLSEDASLRSLHYASSFPDARPHAVRDELPEQSQQSVRESLALLRVKHRSSHRPSVHRTLTEYDRVTSPSFQPAQRLSLSSNCSSSRRPPAKEPRKPSRANRPKPTPPSSVALLPTETCRHCGRSFAEGRLAKHEGVCQRVFGNEHAWGRGPPHKSVQKTASDFSKQNQQEHMLRTLKKKNDFSKNLKHTLTLSFQEHQASLVECPCCRRKFAPSGAQQHIAICKTVQHRPRNPVPLLKDFALAG